MLPRHGSVGTSDKCAHLADLTRNGVLETIFVTQTPTGMGRVSSCNSTGNKDMAPRLQGNSLGRYWACHHVPAQFVNPNSWRYPTALPRYGNRGRMPKLVP